MGAAMMLPAALSILTTTFKEGSDRNTALGVWGGVGGLASAAGVLPRGPADRWSGLALGDVRQSAGGCARLGGIFWLIQRRTPPRPAGGLRHSGDHPRDGGMLLLVFTLVKGTRSGLGRDLTIAELAGAFALLAGFVVNERRSRNPLLPLSIFRVRGLAAADVTQLIAFAGFLAVFSSSPCTLQNVLGYSPIQTEAAYSPDLRVGVAAAFPPSSCPSRNAAGSSSPVR